MKTLDWLGFILRLHSGMTLLSFRSNVNTVHSNAELQERDEKIMQISFGFILRLHGRITSPFFPESCKHFGTQMRRYKRRNEYIGSIWGSFYVCMVGWHHFFSGVNWNAELQERGLINWIDLGSFYVYMVKWFHFSFQSKHCALKCRAQEGEFKKRIDLGLT